MVACMQHKRQAPLLSQLSGDPLHHLCLPSQKQTHLPRLKDVIPPLVLPVLLPLPAAAAAAIACPSVTRHSLQCSVDDGYKRGPITMIPLVCHPTLTAVLC
jgi:hypothetical protein